MTDKEFDFRMELILKGDTDGLRAVYEDYGKYIYKTFVNIVRSPQDAEDLTSDFFLRLWQKAEYYRMGNGHKRSLVTIAHNMAADFLKKRNRTVFALDEEENGLKESIPDKKRTDETAESVMSFGEAMDLLSEPEREIVNLHIGLELTFREISEIMHKPLGSVTWKYSRAIHKLRKFVKEGAAL